MKEVYVVNCCRTAVGSFGGSLKDTPAAEMGAVVIKEALNRAGVKPEQVDEVMFGCILTAGLGQNVARQCALKAGIPISVPAYTVGMVCGSGMKSVIEGARSILAGDAEIIVAGGTENMSAAPYALPAARWGARMGDGKMVDTMIKDGLWDAYNNYHMGTTAENICGLQQLSHGHHRREHLRRVGHHPPGAGRVRRLLPAEGLRRPQLRPLRRRDRPHHGQAEEADGGVQAGRVPPRGRDRREHLQAARRLPRGPRGRGGQH